MPKAISLYKIKRLIFYYSQKEVNKTQVAKSLKISRSTLSEYFSKFNDICRRYPDIDLDNRFFLEKFSEKRSFSIKEEDFRYFDLIARFPSFTKKT